MRSLMLTIFYSLAPVYSYLYSLSETSQTILVHRLNAPGKAELWQLYSFAEAAVKAGIQIGELLIIAR